MRMKRVEKYWGKEYSFKNATTGVLHTQIFPDLLSTQDNWIAKEMQISFITIKSQN
jgi:hypothetical protein